MNQPLKGIIDKIIWAGLDIEEVVTAYKSEVKARAEYQTMIDKARAEAEKKPAKADKKAEEKKNKSK